MVSRRRFAEPYSYQNSFQLLAIYRKELINRFSRNGKIHLTISVFCKKDSFFKVFFHWYSKSRIKFTEDFSLRKIPRFSCGPKEIFNIIIYVIESWRSFLKTIWVQKRKKNSSAWNSAQGTTANNFYYLPNSSEKMFHTTCYSHQKLEWKLWKKERKIAEINDFLDIQLWILHGELYCTWKILASAMKLLKSAEHCKNKITTIS